jgi:hypothetical protein
MRRIREPTRTPDAFENDRNCAYSRNDVHQHTVYIFQTGNGANGFTRQTLLRSGAATQVISTLERNYCRETSCLTTQSTHFLTPDQISAKVKKLIAAGHARGLDTGDLHLGSPSARPGSFCLVDALGQGRQAARLTQSSADQAQPHQVSQASGSMLTSTPAPNDPPQPSQTANGPAVNPTALATKADSAADDGGASQMLDPLDQELSSFNNSLKSSDTLNDFK